MILATKKKNDIDPSAQKCPGTGKMPGMPDYQSSPAQNYNWQPHGGNREEATKAS